MLALISALSVELLLLYQCSKDLASGALNSWRKILSLFEQICYTPSVNSQCFSITKNATFSREEYRNFLHCFWQFHNNAIRRHVKRMFLEKAESFTSDQVTSVIKSCRISRAYGPDFLSIFHLKNLGPLATEHLTSLYNDSINSCRLPSIWKTSLVIPIPKWARSSRRSSYPIPTNFSHQLKIKMASDLDTRLHLPSSSSQETYRQASTSGNHLSVCGHWLDSCFSWHTDIQDCYIIPATHHYSMAVLLPKRETDWN